MQENNVLIYSDETDSVTDKVIEWLVYYESKNIKRINGVPINTSITLENNTYDAIWFRRLQHINTPANSDIERFIIKELKSNYQASIKINEAKKKLGSIDHSIPNKIHVLNKAQLLGIKIPNTLLTTFKKDFLSFRTQCKEVIVKCISDPIIIHEKGKKKTIYTHLLKEKEIDDMPENFFSTLFQERIIKKYEVRSFFIDNVFYSMAVFSSNNSNTEVDVRNYDFKNPNRTVCYKLPIELEEADFHFDKRQMYFLNQAGDFKPYDESQNGEKYRVITFKKNQPNFNNGFKEKNKDLIVTRYSWGGLELKFRKRVKMILVDYYDDGCGEPATSFVLKNRIRKTVGRIENMSFYVKNAVFSAHTMMRKTKYFKLQQCEGYTERIVIVYE